MATKEFIQERIDSVKAKIEKVKAIIEKKQNWILKKEAKLAQTLDENERYWINCDIESLQGDIAYKEKELQRDLYPSLQKWTNELIEIQSIKRDIPVLVEFLNTWKQKVAEYYRKERASESRKTMRQAVIDAKEAYDEQYKQRAHGWFATEEQRAIENRLWEDYQEKKKAYSDRFKTILFWEQRGDFETEMEKTLQQEWEAKYDRLLNDCTAKVGMITDCRGLYVSDRGELNGIIEGKEGRASVYTFIAEGPIQRAHYRCRITKLRDRG